MKIHSYENYFQNTFNRRGCIDFVLCPSWGCRSQFLVGYYCGRCFGAITFVSEARFGGAYFPNNRGYVGFIPLGNQCVDHYYGRLFHRWIYR